jgi:hypothetical protein
MLPHFTSKTLAKSQRTAISSWNFTAFWLLFVMPRSSCIPPLIHRLMIKPSSLLKNPRHGESVVIQFSVTNRRRLA